MEGADLPDNGAEECAGGTVDGRSTARTVQVELAIGRHDRLIEGGDWAERAHGDGAIVPGFGR